MAEHAHGQSHSHGHGHAHGHHADDFWDGAAYLARPGVQETASINAANLLAALSLLSQSHARFAPANLHNLSLIEVGSGPGAVTQHLADSFGIVYATELSANMLKTFSGQPVAQRDNVSFGLVSLGPNSKDEFKARKAFPSPTEAEPERTAAPPVVMFDVAVVNLVLHHVDDINSFMEGVKGVLRPGGVIVVTEFTLAEDGTDVVAKNRAMKAEKDKNAAAEAAGSVNAPGHHHDTFSLESIQKILSDFGFKDVGAARGPFLPVFGPDAEPVPGLYAYGLAP
ncbi:uncharacterized protein CcaverHIS019_0305990 [Cutaneotrichosporon cavernicola]|uniref:S-adenosyl-L-methionine-dependent methyltransferase n=1 Tax=Cutaneotrichosporon cavernicola TaxID=279322 RepID=A0AA48KZH7_9TREE|nr:uncharacterized protein CcaverHIS019_0305990 [Cutaneotrichosporon cavernicola]BEI90529.1 hypothetical protein CcaverHIS019_0305990 [Cutaneotrichosporon cavernicola]BEI98303.1 hypothetical protein CcaverHIS631_0306020 [Cutaneotrichosporon cavernicola]BEJ06078.1 hypothetical protein CcaverHIS641_0306000 [Cutaneotrichosporon cavernicola]